MTSTTEKCIRIKPFSSEYPPVVNDLRISTSEYPSLYEFVVQVIYGYDYSKVEKIEKKTKKLYERIDRVYKDETINDIDDEFMDYAESIFAKLFKIPHFIQNHWRFDELYNSSYESENITDRMYKAYLSDRKRLKEKGKNKKMMNLVLDELETLSPSNLLKEGGSQFKKAEKRYMANEQNRVKSLNKLPLGCLNIQ